MIHVYDRQGGGGGSRKKKSSSTTLSFQTKRLFSKDAGSDMTKEQFQSSSSSSSDEYLTLLGYKDEKVRQGMKDALKAVFGDKITVSNLKSFGMEGEQKKGYDTFL